MMTVGEMIFATGRWFLHTYLTSEFRTNGRDNFAVSVDIKFASSVEVENVFLRQVNLSTYPLIPFHSDKIGCVKYGWTE